MSVSAAGPGKGCVLVVGATGRVGGLVVRELSAAGVPTRCMARDPTSPQAAALEALDGVEVVQGDVGDAASVQQAMVDCTQCVACFGAARVASLKDLFMDNSADPRHPRSVNYQGVVNVVEAAKATPGFEKLVRVTGLSVGYSPFDKIALLLNIVLSMTIKWQTAGERAIRESGLDYTTIRPGNLRDERPPEMQLRLSSGDGVLSHPVGKIDRQAVASLIVAALTHPATARTTLGCTWADKPDPTPPPQRGDAPDWGGLLDTVCTPDDGPLPEKAHLLAVRVLLLGVATFAGALLWLIKRVVTGA